MLRSVLAVLAGYLVFVISTIALFKVSGQDPHAPANLGFMVFSIAYGVLFSAAGGFLAARIGGRYQFEHSLAVAALIASIGAGALMAQPADAPLWTGVSAVLIIAPAAMLGGYVRRRQLAASRRQQI